MKNYGSLSILFCLISIPFLGHAQIQEITNLNGFEDGVPRFINGSTILFNDLIYFRGEGAFSEELFVTDGSEEGEQVIRSREGKRVDQPSSFIILDSIFIFEGLDRDLEEGLYRSNGKSSGTYRILEESISVIQCMIKIGNLVYFKGERLNGPSELWVTDGTSEGTINLRDSSGQFINFPCGFIAYNDKTYFSAEVPGTGSELFVSDGTEAGTYLVKEINPGEEQAFNGTAVVFNDKIFFNATSPGIGNELWESDGTSEGTKLVKDIHVGTSNSFPNPLLISNGLLYFSANDAAHGIEIWTTDGTPAGTQLYYDVREGNVGSSPTYFNVFKDGFIVYANRTGLGFELNFINASGEINLVKDINEGPASASAFNFYQVNDQLYFNARDAIHGKELWTSDGTEDGTFMIQDLEPGEVGSDPELLILLDNGFYFSAYTLAKGRELYFFQFETSSISLFANSIPFKCFPNPTSDYLDIESPFLVKEIRIYNAAGQNVDSQHIAHKENFQISFNQLEAGNYILTLIGSDEITSQVITVY